MKQDKFIMTLENRESPILITVPHGGMKNGYGSWLEAFFKKRTKSETQEENYIQNEKIVVGGDNQILHIACDIFKNYRTNAVVGLLPRCFVDYNRFVPEVAYADQKIQPFYDAYHQAIEQTLERLLRRHKIVTLIDLHGFGKQPIKEIEFDIILGTNGESSPHRIDKLFYNYLKSKYQIFCAGMNGLPEETMYKGDTTNLYYHKKYGIDGVLVEISSKFRSTKIINSKENGKFLCHDLIDFFKVLEKNKK